MIRFHLSLNVSDLTLSVAFYRALLGVEPAKLRLDYAKFETEDPPLVLSLEPTARPIGGPLNHLGFRIADIASLVAMQARLEAAGLRSQREENVECCYAKQTKFWLHDPDGTLWEMYTLDGDIDHRGVGQSESVVLGMPLSTTLEHRMGQDVSERFPHSDESVDEVRLRGTFNVSMPSSDREAILKEAHRVLKPGGRLFVHVLTGDRAVDAPELPGAAAMVRFVPASSDVFQWPETAGFERVRAIKFDDSPCFVRNGVAMRETQIEAWKPMNES